jgi:DNA invertase Pin-like site-specific DNA recombinase
MTLLTPTAPATLSSEKVQERHRDRLAVVYVRQSTPQQIEQHPESTRLQYQLAERARQFGWSPDRVLVIDEDLGRSAASACDRPGFQRLVTEVGLGHVGMIVGIELNHPLIFYYLISVA